MQDLAGLKQQPQLIETDLLAGCAVEFLGQGHDLLVNELDISSHIPQRLEAVQCPVRRVPARSRPRKRLNARAQGRLLTLGLCLSGIFLVLHAFSSRRRRRAQFFRLSLLQPMPSLLQRLQRLSHPRLEEDRHAKRPHKGERVFRCPGLSRFSCQIPQHRGTPYPDPLHPAILS